MKKTYLLKQAKQFFLISLFAIASVGAITLNNSFDSVYLMKAAELQKEENFSDYAVNDRDKKSQKNIRLRNK